MVNNSPSYYKLAKKLRYRKDNWDGKPTPELLYSLGYRSEANDLYWHRKSDNMVFVRAGDSHLPISGNGITESEKSILDEYADNPFKISRYLANIRIPIFTYATYSVLAGIYFVHIVNNHDKDLEYYQWIILNYGKIMLTYCGVSIASLLKISIDGKKLEKSGLSENAINYYYGQEALEELNREKRNLESRIQKPL